MKLKIFTTFMVLSMAHCGSSLQLSLKPRAFEYSVNVMNMGAVGDGTTDDSQAFLKAWAAVCGAQKSEPLLVIPGGKTFLLYPVTFRGPCSSSSVNIQIWGNILAPEYSAWKGKDVQTWLLFDSINWLKIDGNGQIDGRGESWWKNAYSPYNRPSALTFNNCNNLRVNGLHHVNSQRNHITVTGSKSVVLSQLTITAPDSSPNTDGIDLDQSSNVIVKDCTIGTGDDCIAVGTESFNFTFNRITCGPGHGISIGSLGARGTSARVQNILVYDSIFKGTTNGVRIKTWQGGSGSAKNITFDKIRLESVQNPIIIDQYYCPHRNCQNQTSAVRLSDITYHNFRGTSVYPDAVILSCSHTTGCYNVRVSDVKIQNSKSGVVSEASCINAYGDSLNSYPAVDCLKR
ncbi:probable polygalacturonase At3g15720 isoform X1 [Mangifera indica]|uniref:probable polygalacturonase At3g15720 isoform X1 n=1 Tax=Mangifera indica TaxID=29780 RepID=UPI001CFB6AC6|nr:probable polygalacturonase At3g15720 isoform X1 [Mangifera indica]